MLQCNHEEADTRIVIHVTHDLQTGCTRVLVRTVDTDVLVIMVGKFGRLVEECSEADIWIAMGTGRNFTYISVNRVCSALGEIRSRCLPVFHALSECDTTSSFCGKAKRSAWQAWELYDDVTPVFLSLADNPFQHLDTHAKQFHMIERMVVIMYDKTCPHNSINAARKELFCRHNKAMDKLPPNQVTKIDVKFPWLLCHQFECTSHSLLKQCVDEYFLRIWFYDALLQHVRRSIYQAGIWTASDEHQQRAPSPDRFGWQKVDDCWVPIWLTIPEVSKSCRELFKCACKAKCSRCKCAKANLVCTDLCKCKCNN